jgi:hypothetical protein
MTLSNAQTAAAFAVIKAADSAGRADATLTERAQDMREAGFKSEDISGKGQHFAAFQRLTAETILTPKQFETWGNAEMTSKVRKDGKQVNTARGLLVDRVNSVIKRVRDRLAKLEAAPASDGKGKGKGASNKGAGKAKRSSTQVFFDTLDGYVKAFAKDDASDKFEFDTKIARAAFVKLLKELK